MAHKRIKQHRIVVAFGKSLRNARIEAGLSQVELAKAAGINVGYLGRLERAESAPGLDMAARLAEALGIAVTDLIAEPRGNDKALKVATTQVRKTIKSLIARGDEPTIKALAVILRMVDGAAARDNR